MSQPPARMTQPPGLPVLEPVATDEPPSRPIWHLADLVFHLTVRQLRSTHRRTALGWSWPLLMQLVQLLVLVFVFQTVIDIGIDDYPTFVFTGLIFFNWLQLGLIGASSAIVDNRALVMEPRMLTIALPIAALAVAGFDLLAAMPVLFVMVGLTKGITLAVIALPAIIAIQLVLMLGLALILSATHVYWRDVRPLAIAILLLLFYLTPVFYSLDVVPDRFQWASRLNPATTLVDSYHAILLDGDLPSLGPLIVLSGVSLALLAIGLIVFRRLRPGFVDEL